MTLSDKAMRSEGSSLNVESHLFRIKCVLHCTMMRPKRPLQEMVIESEELDSYRHYCMLDVEIGYFS